MSWFQTDYLTLSCYISKYFVGKCSNTKYHSEKPKDPSEKSDPQYCVIRPNKRTYDNAKRIGRLLVLLLYVFLGLFWQYGSLDSVDVTAAGPSKSFDAVVFDPLRVDAQDFAVSNRNLSALHVHFILSYTIHTSHMKSFQRNSLKLNSTFITRFYQWQ